MGLTVMARPRDTQLELQPSQYSVRHSSQSCGWINPAFKRIVLMALVHLSLARSASATCMAPQNAIEAENCQPGNPISDWYVYQGSPNIQGFTTDISVNVGQTIFLKIQTN